MLGHHAISEYALGAYDDVTFSTAGGRRRRTTVLASLGCRLDLEHPLSRGLTGWWKAPADVRGARWYDFSPHRNDGLLSGMAPCAAWVAGPRGMALGFDGADDHVTMGDAPELDLGTGNAALMAWVQFWQVQPDLDGTDHVSTICGKGCLGDVLGHGLILLEDTVQYQVRYSSSSRIESTSNTTLRNGKWHHVCGTLDRGSATGIRLYVDGILQTSKGDGTLTAGIELANDAPFAVGARWEASWGCRFLGRLDDVRLYRRCLSAAEVRWAYEDSATQRYGMLRRPRTRRLAAIELLAAPPEPPVTGRVPWHLLFQRAV